MGLDFGKTSNAQTAKQKMQLFANTNTKDRIVDIPVEKLHESPLNRNMPTDNLDELAASIKDNGLQEALLVYNLPDGTYEIYAGHRRFRAGRDLIGMKSFPCVVKKYPKDAKVRFQDHFVNNAERRENNFRYWVAEITEARKLLEESGFSGSKQSENDEIAELLNGKVSPAQIYRYEAVAKMVPEMAKLGDVGYAVSTLYAAVRLSPAEQKHVAETVMAKTDVENGLLITQKEFASIVERERGREKKPEPEKTVRNYESKLINLEGKVTKLIGAPKTEEDKKLALSSIIRIRSILDEMENKFRS